MARTGARPGFVFCARVADHPVPQFRLIEAAVGAQDMVRIASDTLACLGAAHAEPDTIRVLDEETRQRAYQAWELARLDIHAQWIEASDPRAAQPVIPKAMRNAADLLRNYPPAGRSQTEIERMLDALESSYPARIQQIIRTAIRSSDRPARQAELVAAAVEDLGLEPTVQPEPLPVITMEDIHLLCWQAIVPTDPRTGSAWPGPAQLSMVPGPQIEFGE